MILKALDCKLIIIHQRDHLNDKITSKLLTWGLITDLFDHWMDKGIFEFTALSEEAEDPKLGSRIMIDNRIWVLIDNIMKMNHCDGR